MSSYFIPAIIGCLITITVGVIIILTQSLHGRWTIDEQVGVQKFHVQPTPRIGGVAIIFGTFIASAFLDNDSREVVLPFLISGLIPFLFGFGEDLTKCISANNRLLGIVLGAVIAIFLTNQYLDRLDVPFIDRHMIWWPIPVSITVIAIAGVTNAINILDGFNGLASGTVMVVLFFFALMASRANDFSLMIICLMFCGVILGFMLLNYPLGKIFLGDAGAYFLGFLLAWIAVLLPLRSPEISPWASLLASAYPIVEVLYSIGRRIGGNVKATAPDNLHLHTLIKTKIIRGYFKFLPAWAKNSLVAPVIWFVSILLGWSSMNWSSDVYVLASFFIGFIFFYHLTYCFLVKLSK